MTRESRRSSGFAGYGDLRDKQPAGWGTVMRAGALASAVALMAVGLAASPLADVDRIVLTSPVVQTSAAEVRAAVGLVGEPMVRLEIAEAQARLEALPWIRSARITRRWPATLEVAVTERRPVASVSTGPWPTGPSASGPGSESAASPAPAGPGPGVGVAMVLVDDFGRVLGPSSEALGLPVVILPSAATGAPATILRPGDQLSTRILPALAVAAASPPALVGRLRSIVANDGGVSADLGSGASARFGSADGAGAKAASLLAVLEQVDLADVELIDVRVPARPAVVRSAHATAERGQGA
ncbi:MAG: cell division protein FtsQ/DivIB [Acidimicrobiales bacterium]